MANTKISALTALTGANVATDDELAIVDASATETKKITFANFLTASLGSTNKTGATITADSPLINQAQTWNAGAVTFTGWKLNITDTASASSSLLLDLQVGGASQFSVAKTTGNITANGDLWLNATGSGGALIRAGATSARSIYLNGSSAAAATAAVGGSGIAVGSGKWFAFSSVTNPGSTPDIYLSRVAAGVMSVRGASSAAGTVSLGTQTVADLPAASTAGVGSVAFVSDATATTPRSTVAGTGANFVMVMSDGTNWLIVA